MKVLVTGSTGFLGGRLCRGLVEAGHQVRAFHRPTSTTRLLDDLDVEHATGDLTRPETLAEALDGIEVVFHAAAQLGGRDEPGRMYSVTVEGTRSLLAAARQAGVRRFVHTSSVSALGVPNRPALHKPEGRKRQPPRPDATQPRKGFPASRPAGPEAPTIPSRETQQAQYLMDENHTWNYRPERWPYGYSKYLAEMEVQAAVAAGMDAVILNPSVVFGAGDIYRQESSLVVQVARRRLPALIEGGLNAVHIADVVAGHLAALEHGRTGERYILGGQNMSVRALMECIAGVVGAPVPVLSLPGFVVRAMARPFRILDAFLNSPVSASTMYLAGRYFYYDIRKAQVELGLPPPRPVEEAVREAYEWFKAVGAVR